MVALVRVNNTFERFASKWNINFVMKYNVQPVRPRNGFVNTLENNKTALLRSSRPVETKT